MTERYDLVFEAERVRGVELLQAKHNLAKLFNISAEKVDALFCGKSVTLKKGLDFETATKYRVAIKKAGCIAQLREVTVAEQQTQKTPVDERSSGTKVPVSDLRSQDSSETTGQQTDVADDQGLSLSPVGSDVLMASERRVIESIDIDVSDFSIAETGTDLLADDEKTIVERVNIDVNLQLSPLGSDVLSDDEKSNVAVRDVDVSAYDLAEPGSDLGQALESKQDVSVSTDHLSLLND